MNGMTRWVWITASLAALFGLQGALCSLSCLEPVDRELASQQPMAEMPCHGTPEGSNPDPAQPVSEDGCSCGASVVARTAEAAAISQGHAAGMLPTFVVSLRLVPGPLPRHHGPAPERLPPPDTLLLNSTLIV
jgi:hypothetical protein